LTTTDETNEATVDGEDTHAVVHAVGDCEATATRRRHKAQSAQLAQLRRAADNAVAQHWHVMLADEAAVGAAKHSDNVADALTGADDDVGIGTHTPVSAQACC
jgi:hypothetical protein